MKFDPLSNYWINFILRYLFYINPWHTTTLNLADIRLPPGKDDKQTDQKLSVCLIVRTSYMKANLKIYY